MQGAPTERFVVFGVITRLVFGARDTNDLESHAYVFHNEISQEAVDEISNHDAHIGIDCADRDRRVVRLQQPNNLFQFTDHLFRRVAMAGRSAPQSRSR